jgi:hypothetical protein
MILPDPIGPENSPPQTTSQTTPETDPATILGPDDIEEYEEWLAWLDSIHDQDRHEDEVIRAFGCVEARRGPAH